MLQCLSSTPRILAVTTVLAVIVIGLVGCAGKRSHSLGADVAQVGDRIASAQSGAKPIQHSLGGTNAPRPLAPNISTSVVPVTIRTPEIRNTPPLSPQINQGEIRATDIPGPARPSPKGRGHAVDPALKIDSEDRSSVTPLQPLSGSFDSTDFDDNATLTGGNIFIPPDSHAAAGPNAVCGVVNVTIQCHAKDGTSLFQTSLAAFFSGLTPLTFTFDAKIIYDQYAERFVVVTLEQTDTMTGGVADTSRIFVAVSDDNNPVGNWTTIAINSVTSIGGNSHWADYPGLAVGEEAVYITNNMFRFASSGGTFGGVRLWIIEKGLGSGGFYDGAAASVSIIDPYAGGGFANTTQPAHMFGSAPTNVGTFLVSYSGLTNGVQEFAQVVRLDDPLGTPVLTQEFISLGDIEDLTATLADAPQSGLSTLIEVNDRRALNAVWRNDELWMATTIDPKAPDSNNGEATAFIIELDTSTLGSTSLADTIVIGGEDIATNTSTFFPSVAVNNVHDVIVGFSASASSIFAGSYYATHAVGDAAGTIGSSETLRAGLASYIRTFGAPLNRWGDYSGSAVDPVDECFWVFNQYAITTGTPSNPNAEDGRWGTAFGNVCVSTAPDTDLDGVADDADNCIDIPNGPLIPDLGGNSQRDTDSDGYGNVCDADFNNNGLVDGIDFSALKAVLGSNSDPDQDLNGNGIVDGLDFSTLKANLGQAPGPSCCGM